MPLSHTLSHTLTRSRTLSPRGGWWSWEKGKKAQGRQLVCALATPLTPRKAAANTYPPHPMENWRKISISTCSPQRQFPLWKSSGRFLPIGIAGTVLSFFSKAIKTVLARFFHSLVLCLWLLLICALRQQTPYFSPLRLQLQFACRHCNLGAGLMALR